MSLLSSRKDAIKSHKNYMHNRPIKSRVRTYAKKAMAALLNNAISEEDVRKHIVEYEKLGMRAAKTNIVNKAAVSRKVSRLVLQMKKRFSHPECVMQ